MIRPAVERVLESQETEDDEDEGREDGDRFDELYERLDEYESLTDFTDRPVSAFIANLCDAMGLDFDWSLFEYDPWAMKEAETKAEGSPFAEWRASTRDDVGDDPPEDHARNGTGPPPAEYVCGTLSAVLPIAIAKEPLAREREREGLIAPAMGG